MASYNLYKADDLYRSLELLIKDNNVEKFNYLLCFTDIALLSRLVEIDCSAKIKSLIERFHDMDVAFTAVNNGDLALIKDKIEKFGANDINSLAIEAVMCGQKEILIYLSEIGIKEWDKIAKEAEDNGFLDDKELSAIIDSGLIKKLETSPFDSIFNKITNRDAALEQIRKKEDTAEKLYLLWQLDENSLEDAVIQALKENNRAVLSYTLDRVTNSYKISYAALYYNRIDSYNELNKSCVMGGKPSLYDMAKRLVLLPIYMMLCFFTQH